MKLALTALLTLSCGGLALAQSQTQMDTQSTQSQSGATQTPTYPAAGQPAGTTSPQPGAPDSAAGTSGAGTGTSSPAAGTGATGGAGAATGTPSSTDGTASAAQREVTVDLKTEAPPPQDPRAAREEAAAALRYARTEGCRNAGSREAQRECLRQAQSDYREALGQSTPMQRSRH